MPDVNPQDTEKSLKNIQNIALILTGATEFVCEPRMLKRFSGPLQENLQKLEANIASFKEKFPGRFSEELDPDSSLKKIRNISEKLKRANTNIETECQSGQLGDELLIVAIELKGTVQAIFNAITGKVSKYTLVDKLASYSGDAKSVLVRLSPLVSNTGRLILAITLVIIFAFIYLVFTMESEKDFLESITKDQVYLVKQKDLLEKQKKEYSEILEKVKTFENNEELLEENKIEYLNLSVEEKKLKDFLDKAQIAIEQKENNIEEQKRNLEELQKKSFFQKLLKR